MPITENVNGVLHTHSVEPENVGGVIREKDFVHTNDGGVLREIFHANKGAVVKGITPLVVADDHIVIVDSGTFTLSAPAGTRIIVGGGAQNGENSYTESNWQGKYAHNGFGGKGGYVAQYILTNEIRNATCTLSVGDSVAYNAEQTATTLTIGGTTYDSGSTVQIIQSKWGPIGGNGGLGGSNSDGSDGTGAGGGGGSGANRTEVIKGFGGNCDGYGNKGGTPTNTISIKWGGKGGYASGGGGAGIRQESTTSYVVGQGGKGGSGIIVIEWDNQ